MDTRASIIVLVIVALIALPFIFNNLYRKMKDTDTPEKVLEFYDSKDFMPTEKELSLTENWLNIINSNIISKK